MKRNKKISFVKKSSLSMKNLLCLWNVMSIKCPIYEMSLSMKCPIHEKSYPWNVLSMILLYMKSLSMTSPIYEMSLYMKCLINEMSYLWHCYLWKVFLWNVLSMKSPINEKFLSMKCLYLWIVQSRNVFINEIFYLWNVLSMMYDECCIWKTKLCGTLTCDQSGNINKRFKKI